MLKPTVSFFVFFLFSFCCFAQQSELLYLNNLIEKNKDEKNEAILKKTFEVESEKSKSDNQKNNIEIVYATLLADLYFDKTDFVNIKSSSLFKEAILRSAESNHDLMIWTSTQYGYYMYSNSLYKDALPYFLSASRFMDNSTTKLSIQSTDILKKNAFYFGTIEYFSRSNAYLKKALQITDKKSFEYGTLLNALGANYKKSGNVKLAETYFNKTLEISKINNDKIRYAKALGDLASIFAQNKNYKKAEEYLLEDIKISKQYNSVRNLMYAQIQLGNFYYQWHQFKKSVLLLNEAEKYAASKLNLKGFEQQIIKIKLNIAVDQKDSKAELEQRRKLETISLYVSKTDGEQVVNKLNVEVQNDNIKLQLSLEKGKLEKENLIKKASIIIGIILLFLLIILFRMNKRKLKYQQIEFNQKILAFKLDKINSENKLYETHNSLASYKTSLIEKTAQIKQLEEEIAKKDNSVSGLYKKEVFKKLLDSHLLTEDNWLKFKNEFIKEQYGFYESTIQKYPDLTESNLRLIILLKMGLTNQNIANLLGVTLEAVKKAKQRLKKKHETILKDLD